MSKECTFFAAPFLVFDTFFFVADGFFNVATFLVVAVAFFGVTAGFLVVEAAGFFVVAATFAVCALGFAPPFTDFTEDFLAVEALVAAGLTLAVVNLVVVGFLEAGLVFCVMMSDQRHNDFG